MPMSPYPVRCYGKDCKKLASYKIAARWSDGATSELKTYALSCPKCLPELFRMAQEKQKRCRLAPGETLEVPGIWQLTRGLRDRQLERLTELEAQLSQPGENESV